VVSQLRNTPCKKIHFVLGMVSDKEISNVLALLPSEAIYYFTQAGIPRSLDADLLRNKAESYGLKGESYRPVAAAFAAAKAAAHEEDLVFVGGSNFVVGEIL